MFQEIHLIMGDVACDLPERLISLFNAFNEVKGSPHFILNKILVLRLITKIIHMPNLD